VAQAKKLGFTGHRLRRMLLGSGSLFSYDTSGCRPVWPDCDPPQMLPDFLGWLIVGFLIFGYRVLWFAVRQRG
jgi:hypothetical protein